MTDENQTSHSIKKSENDTRKSSCGTLDYHSTLCRVVGHLSTHFPTFLSSTSPHTMHQRPAFPHTNIASIGRVIHATYAHQFTHLDSFSSILWSGPFPGLPCGQARLFSSMRMTVNGLLYLLLLFHEPYCEKTISRAGKREREGHTSTLA